MRIGWFRQKHELGFSCLHTRLSWVPLPDEQRQTVDLRSLWCNIPSQSANIVATIDVRSSFHSSIHHSSSFLRLLVGGLLRGLRGPLYVASGGADTLTETQLMLKIVTSTGVNKKWCLRWERNSCNLPMFAPILVCVHNHVERSDKNSNQRFLRSSYVTCTTLEIVWPQTSGK